MNPTDDKLCQLIHLALSLPPSSPERQAQLNKIYCLVMRSGKLWRGYSFQRQYYGDALQEMWEHCLSNLDSYQPEISGVITWLNDHLKRILQKYAARHRREFARRAYGIQTEQGICDPIDTLQASPDPQLGLDMLSELLEWVQTDPDGQLHRRVCKRYAHVHAQTLLLRRLPPKTRSWEQIANELNADKTYLAQWYARHCYPLLRQWAHNRGYLTEQDP